MSGEERSPARTRAAFERVRLVLHALVVGTAETDGAALVLTQAVSGAGAAGGAVLVTTPDGGWAVAAGTGSLAGRGEALRRAAADRGDPLGHAVTVVEPVWVRDGGERDRRFPSLTRPRDGHEGGRAAVPLVAGDVVVGALVLEWDDPHEPTRDEQALVSALADLAALAVRQPAVQPVVPLAARPRLPRPTVPADAGIDADARPVAGPAEVADLLGALFAHAPVGFALIDTDLRFVAVNDALAAVNGLPAADHLGRPVADVLPDLAPGAIDALRHVLATGEPLRDVEVSGRTPASPAHRTWLEDFYRVTAPSGEVLGVAAVLSDVTAQRRGERRMRQLIDALFSFVGLCDPDGRLLEANRTALEAGGLTAEEVIGREVWLTGWFTWDPAVSERVRQAVLRARAGEASRFDVEVRMRDGHLVVDLQIAPVVEDGEVVALVPSATDVTGRRRSVEQATRLAALARRLNAVTTVEEVVDVVSTDASAVVGSLYATVALLSRDGSSVDLVQSPQLPGPLRGRYGALPIGSPLHVTRAVREGRTVLLRDPVLPQDVGGDADLARRLREDRTLAGVTASVAVPVVGGDGTALGSLTMGWARAGELDDELVARVETVAELCAQSIERARLHAAEHELVDGLQRRLLRPPPPVEGLDTAAAYRAAQTAVGIGGDFHDGIALPDGRVALLVGDVAGHGVEAAADMAQLRTALSTLLAAGTPPDRLFAEADRVLGLVTSTSLATAVVAVVDLAAGTLTYSHAGHPPLVVRHPDGTTRTLDDGRAPILGVAGLHLRPRTDAGPVEGEAVEGGATGTSATVPFPPGTLVVAYTDGLVESRGGSIDDGIAALVAAVGRAPRTAGARDVADRVLADCVGDRALEDDVALLVVRRPAG